jgi:membrane protein DedA with SNARE-associated domain
VATTLLGFLPWGLVVGAMTLQAIESPSPLTMSVVTWLVLLLPLWVAWFAVVAWNKRDETAMPAVLMALPAIVATVMLLAMPVAQSAP